MSTTVMTPPKLSKYFLHWALPDELKEPVLGDLEEEFLLQIQVNPSTASAWYRRQALKSGWQFIQKTKRGLLMFLFSILIFVGLTYMAMALGGGLGMFIDTPSVLIVFPATISFTIAASSWSKFTQAFQHLLNQDQSQTESELIISKQVFAMLGNISLWLGAAMTVVGWVAIGSNLDDPSSFGPAVGVSILTLLYAMLFKVICYAAEQKLQFKMNLQNLD